MNDNRTIDELIAQGREEFEKRAREEETQRRLARRDALKLALNEWDTAMAWENELPASLLEYIEHPLADLMDDLDSVVFIPHPGNWDDYVLQAPGLMPVKIHTEGNIIKRYDVRAAWWGDVQWKAFATIETALAFAQITWEEDKERDRQQAEYEKHQEELQHTVDYTRPVTPEEALASALRHFILTVVRESEEDVS